MDWSCLIYYPIAAVLGFILGWLMFSNKGKLREYELSANREKAVANDLLTEHNTYKKDMEAKLNMRSAEVDLLKKKLTAAQNLPTSSAKSNLEIESLKTELNTYKLKVVELEQDLAFADSRNIETIEPDEFSKEIEHLKKSNQMLHAELDSTLNLVKVQNEKIKSLKADAEALPDSPSPAIHHSQSKKIAKLKAKLKAQKKALKAAKNGKSNEDIIQSIDLGKLALFLQDENSYKKKGKSKGKKKKSST